MLESLYNKVAGLQSYEFIKKRLQRKYFPVNLVKFLKPPFLQNTSEGLLVYIFLNLDSQKNSQSSLLTVVSFSDNRFFFILSF